jgi:hypothetical protein
MLHLSYASATIRSKVEQTLLVIFYITCGTVDALKECRLEPPDGDRQAIDYLRGHECRLNGR